MAGYLTAKAHRVGAGGGVAFHPAAGFSGRRQHPRQGDRCIVAGTVEHGMGPGGEVAVSAQLDQECPLGVDAPPGPSVLDDPDHGIDGHVVGTALDGQGSLGHLGHHLVDGEDVIHTVGQAESLQRHRGHHHGASGRDAAEPGGHVAPKLYELQVRSKRRELGPAPL